MGTTDSKPVTPLATDLKNCSIRYSSAMLGSMIYRGKHIHLTPAVSEARNARQMHESALSLRSQCVQGIAEREANLCISAVRALVS